MRRFIITLLSVSALVLSSFLTSTSPSMAASTTIVEQATKSVPFSRTVTFYASDIKRCLKVTVTGTMKVQYLRTKDYLGNDYQSLTNPKIYSPKMTLKTTASCGSTTPAKVSGVKLTQSFSYHTCGGSVTYSVSYPLTVGIAWTPECGSRSAITRSMGFSVTSDSFTQANPDGVGTVRKVVSGRTSTAVRSCVAIGTLVTAKNPATVGVNVKLDAGDICVTV